MRIHLLAVSLALATALPAQDMIGVSWSGAIWTFDSTTGVGSMVGTGMPGQNALGKDGSGRLWCTTRTTTTPYVYGLTTIDPTTFTATSMFTGTVDYRGFATGSGGQLLGIRDGSPDVLHSIDTTTGVGTLIGPTGLSSIQGFADHLGTLYAWDLGLGLVTINPLTGTATDVNPSVGATGVEVQWMCSHSSGRLLAGRNNLYVIDPATGVGTLLGNIGSNIDLRGAEEMGGSYRPFGQGCNGPAGPVTLTGSGNPRAGNTIQFKSQVHAPSTLGVFVFGYSNTVYAGLPLPIDLGAIAGINGCFLLVSLDATVTGFTGPSAPADLIFNLGLPSWSGGMTFHVQHAAFDPVPAGMSWSNGLTVRVSM